MQFDDQVAAVRAGTRSAADAAGELVEQLTDPELLGLLDGDLSFWPGMIDTARHGYNHVPVVAGRVDRLGIPGIRFTDGPRGIVMGHATCFPVAMARGATWDPALEEEIGRAIGAEGRALGANLFAGVCINLLRHPAWGRAQETYGEDPVLLGALGSALARGVRSHLMACVKHYACNSMENARFVVDVTVDDDALHEVYLPHFKAVLDAGAESVMSSYNSVNGEWAGQNRVLLTDILRDEWAFDGFVMSDFIFGHRDPVASVGAGLDLEMPNRQQRARALPEALADGRLDRADVETAAVRLLATQLRHHVRDRAEPLPQSSVAGLEHRALARRAAAQAMVLLRNEPVEGRPLLPLDPAALRSIAVVGVLASAANLGDLGSSTVHPPSVVSPLSGITAALPGVPVRHADGRDLHAAAEAAATSDVAVVVVGYTSKDEGEALVASVDGALSHLPPPVGTWPISAIGSAIYGFLGRKRLIPGGDRVRLTLRPHDEALIAAVRAVNPRTVVVMIGSSAVITEAWRTSVPATLMAWYPGMEGGHALADVLLGHAEPGGRLPFAVPTSTDHLPPFDPEARSITYDRWWGQRKLDRDGHEPAHPLGFGLGYTSFTVDDLLVESVSPAERSGTASIQVANVGDRPGATVVQLYARAAAAGAEVPVDQLVGFARVELGAGERRRITVDLALQPLYRRDPRTHGWSPREQAHVLCAGQHCGDPAAVTVALEVPWTDPGTAARMAP